MARPGIGVARSAGKPFPAILTHAGIVPVHCHKAYERGVMEVTDGKKQPQIAEPAASANAGRASLFRSVVCGPAWLRSTFGGKHSCNKKRTQETRTPMKPMKKTALILSAVVILALTGGLAAQDPPAKDGGGHLGTWRLVSTKYGEEKEFSDYPSERQRLKAGQGAEIHDKGQWR